MGVSSPYRWRRSYRVLDKMIPKLMWLRQQLCVKMRRWDLLAVNETQQEDDDAQKKWRANADEVRCCLVCGWCSCCSLAGLASNRRKSTCQTREAGCCGATLLLAASIFFVALWAQMQRWRHLEPLLSAIQSAELCHYEGHARCTLVMRPGDIAAYDLDSPREDELLGFLWAQAVQQNGSKMREILRGAYILLPASGSLGNESTYNWLRSTQGAFSRGWEGKGSSHYSRAEQFQVIEGTVLCCVLTGTANNNRTWLQFEGAHYNFADPAMFWSSMGHIIDFVVYTIYFRPGAGHKFGPLRLGPTRNVGPLGLAIYTDTRPLPVDHALTVQDACPRTCAARKGGGGEEDGGAQVALPSRGNDSGHPRQRRRRLRE